MKNEMNGKKIYENVCNVSHATGYRLPDWATKYTVVVVIQEFTTKLYEQRIIQKIYSWFSLLTRSVEVNLQS